MPHPPCTVCETAPTAYLFTRLVDGTTVNVCDGCQPAFAAWLLEMTTGADPAAVLAMAGSGEVTPAEGDDPDGTDFPPPPDEPVGPKKATRGRSRPTSSNGEGPPASPPSEGDDATAADVPF